MRVTVGALGQRGTVDPLSPCEGDSGVSVFGLARSPHFLALCPRSCFSLSLFVLANTRWHLAAARSPACARGPRISGTSAPGFVSLGNDQVHTYESS